MRRTILLLAVPVLSLIMYSCQSAKTSAAAKMLKFNFEKGKGYDYEMTMGMNQEIDSSVVKMDMSYYFSINVTDEDAGVKNLLSTIDRFAMYVNAGGDTLDIDTDKPVTAAEAVEVPDNPQQMLNTIFATLRGQQFTMKVNAEGKVLEVSGFDEMISKMFSSIGLSGEQRAIAEAQLKEQFNSDKMKSQFERTWYIFPNKEVKVGDNWKRTTDMLSAEMQGKYNSVYKVTDIEGEMVTLEENSVIVPDNGSTSNSGKVKGTLVVDSRAGIVVTADQDMTITTMIEGKPVDMKMKAKIRGKAR